MEFNEAVGALDALEEEALRLFREAECLEDVEVVRIEFLGKSYGRLRGLGELLKTMASADKRSYGLKFNAVKQGLQVALEKAKEANVGRTFRAQVDRTVIPVGNPDELEKLRRENEKLRRDKKILLEALNYVQKCRRDHGGHDVTEIDAVLFMMERKYYFGLPSNFVDSPDWTPKF